MDVAPRGQGSVAASMGDRKQARTEGGYRLAQPTLKPRVTDMTDEAQRSGREHRVRERAYKIWEEQGRPGGQHDDHWHQANREIDDETEIEELADAEHDTSQGSSDLTSTAAAEPARDEMVEAADAEPIGVQPDEAGTQTADAEPKRRAGAKPKLGGGTGAAAPALKPARKPRTLKPKL
jgi:hypothetical protein